MTELNALMNGIENVETREGDFFSPVEGERFGLVITNPPYVISPDTSFLYRDAGRAGDSLCRAMLADLPRYLDDGGFAALQCNWAHGASEPWYAGINDGLAGSGCDSFALRLMSESQVEYATRWPEHQHGGDPEGYRETVQRWLDHLRSSGIEFVATAMVVLRRRDDARNWRRTITISGLPEEPLGEDMVQLFDTQERELTSESRLRPAADLKLERNTTADRGERCAVESQHALGTRRPVSPETAELVLALDGGRPLGVDPPDDLRALVKLGYVTFVD
jgi:hypothetical protein